jgi:hypothetical protein
VIAQIELPEFDVGQIVQVLVVFFLFVLPALRGIVKSKQKQQEYQERRGGQPSPREAADADPARDAWEQLLRGETTQAPEPQDPVELEGLFPELVEEEPELPAPAPVPVRRERVADRTGAATELAGLGGRSAAEDLPAQFAPDLHLAAAPEFSGLSESPPLEATVARQASEPAWPGARDGWRRAIVLSEVLGPPVSLREGAAWPGPPVALR